MTQILVGLTFLLAASNVDQSWLSCIDELTIPRYPPLARQARLVGTVTAVIQISDSRGPDLRVEGEEPILRAVTEDTLRRSRFRSACAGKKLTLRYTFLIEGPASELPDSTSIRIKTPDEFVISTPPRVTMP